MFELFKILNCLKNSIIQLSFSFLNYNNIIIIITTFFWHLKNWKIKIEICYINIDRFFSLYIIKIIF